MTGEEKLNKKLETVLDKSKADETEIVYIGSESGLTRYANSAIHQNVAENNHTLYFRVVLGKKIGVASTNSMITGDMVQTLQNAIEIAKTQPENPDFPGLPKPAAYRELDTYDETTAGFSPADRARIVRDLIRASDAMGFDLAGAFSTSHGEVAVMNSHGVRAYQPTTVASINMIAMSATSSGYAAGMSRKVNDIDFDKLARRAVTKCDLSQNPRQIDTGEYEVILEPAAVAELMEWLNYIGFGSRAFQEKTSFLAGKIGRKITSPMITIVDDGLDKNSIAFPFDFEGVPKKKVVLIDKGKAKGVVYDRMSAVKENGVKSTGHAMPPDQSMAAGSFALNVTMAPGKAAASKMIEKVKKGILITRFHYINGFIDTPNAVLTGMTRDGTFLIEKGEIVTGIKNLRFTDSMLRAFGTAAAVSRERELVDTWWGAVGCCKVPAMHLKSFKFTGKTDF